MEGTRPWIVMVGGFLGAGKTTLLLAAARELERRGMRSAVILNDQGDALVDTQYAVLHHLPNGEVAGGCFCCRYSELTSVMEKVRVHSPDVIFAEPVGSCTDISATILHPLQELIDSYRIAPFTVLVDPKRGESLTSESADANLRFLFLKQLEEADIVCFTKADIHQNYPEIGVGNVRRLSAKTGQGVSGWLDEVLSGRLSSGSSVLEIDYEQYAQAEASLAWLNLEATILTDPPVSPAMVLGPIFDQLDADFTTSRISIVHLKAIIRSESGFLKAAICHNGQQPDVEGALDASPTRHHELLLNLRATGEAEQVRSITERIFNRLGMEIADLQMNCFHPAAPEPERRIWIGHANRSMTGAGEGIWTK